MDTCTVWVVVKPDDRNARVQDVGYLEKERADKRAKHLNDTMVIRPCECSAYDRSECACGAWYEPSADAEVWPVQVYLPDFGVAPVTPAPFKLPGGSWMATVGRGENQIASKWPERTFSMASVVQSAVEAEKARLGAETLTEEHLTAIGVPPSLFEEHGGQLRLFPRDLP